MVPSLGGIEVGVRNGGRIDGRIAGGTRLEIRVRHAERRRNLRASRDGRERLLHLPSIAVVGLGPSPRAGERGLGEQRRVSAFGRLPRLLDRSRETRLLVEAVRLVSRVARLTLAHDSR